MYINYIGLNILIMATITNDLYFTHININPSAINVMVCKNWYTNIIGVLKKKKQTFYELQIYNLIVNKYSNYPPYRVYNIRRKIDFTENKGKYCETIHNIYNIAYDNMIKEMFNHLREDSAVFLNIKESMILYYNKYFDMYIKNSKPHILSYDHIDENIANEYKKILKNHYNYVISYHNIS
jgi:hypothetical protein